MTSTTIAPLSSTAPSHAAAPYWSELTDVACSAIGGAVLFATDDWFASAERLVAPSAPRFEASAFTDWGKWMDGWETRRKRTVGAEGVGGHDWCVVALAAPARVYGFEVDTAFFTGNQAPRISVQGAYLPHRFGGEADAALVAARDARRRAVGQGAAGGGGLAEGGFAAGEEEVQAVAALSSDAWAVMLDQTPLRPGYEDTRHHQFTAKAGAGNSGNVVTHLRINIFPDGGVARLRVRGEIVRPNLQGQRIDVAAAANGGAVLGASNAHYGRASNLIAPGESQRMDQGWETARNPNRPAVLAVGADGMLDLPASMAEWAIMRLACEVNVEEVRARRECCCCVLYLFFRLFLFCSFVHAPTKKNITPFYSFVVVVVACLPPPP
jgi:allantoicase